jgi:hypothetical protein
MEEIEKCWGRGDLQEQAARWSRTVRLAQMPGRTRVQRQELTRANPRQGASV